MDKVCIVLLLSIAVAASGTFVAVPDLFNMTNLIKGLKPFLFPNVNSNVKNTYVNLCIFSTDIAQYMPKCFLCPEAAYQSIYQACVENGNSPNNVSFNQATCLEQNCAINYPTSGEVVQPIRIGRELAPKTITPFPFPFTLPAGLNIAAPPFPQILSGPWSLPALLGQGTHKEDGTDKKVLPGRNRQYESPVPVNINGTEYQVVNQKLLYAFGA